MTRRVATMLLSGAMLVIASSGAVLAQTDKQEYDSRILTDKLTIALGGLATNFQTDLAAGRTLGVLISLEDVLGYEENLDTFAVSGFYRLGTKYKHGIGFGLFAFDRSTSGTLMGTLPIFDEDYVGDFKSTFDVRLFRFVYRYSFVNTGKTEAGFNAGLSTYQFDFTIDGSVQVGDPMNPTIEARSEKTDLVAPLPSFGFFINYAIKPKLIVGMSTDALDLNLGDVSGRLLNTDVRFSWYFSKYVGIGLAFMNTDINYDNSDKKSGEQLKVEYSQKGATIFFTFGF